MSLLAVIGDLVEDVIVWQSGPLAHGTDTPARIHRTRGGSAANVAALAAPLVATRFIGRVGNDATGAALEASLRASHVDVRLQIGGRTGTIVILVAPDGERSMLPDRGASAEIEAIDPAWLDGVTGLHVTAYSLAAEPARSAALDAASIVRASGSLTSLDISSVSVLETLGRDLISELVATLNPDILFANASEASYAPTDGRRLVVIKAGASPTTLRSPLGEASVPVEKVENIRDMTGAGDAFAAGFLASCLTAGLDAGTLATLHPGDERLRTAALAAHANAATVLQLPGSGHRLDSPQRKEPS